MPRKKKSRGRPPVKSMPEQIDATPERIAETVLQFNPTGHEWQYLKNDKTQSSQYLDSGNQSR